MCGLPRNSRRARRPWQRRTGCKPCWTLAGSGPEGAGLSGDFAEALYRDIVTYCVGEEKKEWEGKLGGA